MAAASRLFRGVELDISGNGKCSFPEVRKGRRGAHGRLTQWPLPAGSVMVVRSASVSTVEQTEYEKGQREPRWAGDDPLARFVTSLIAIKPLYNGLAFFARKVMIRTAEKSGVPWQKMVKELKESDVYAEKDLLENVNISYPDYFTQPIHSYEDGNLSWEPELLKCFEFAKLVNTMKGILRQYNPAVFHRISDSIAFDAEPVTKIISKRMFRHIDSPQLAEETLRFRWLQEIEAHHTKYSNGLQASAILDVACSTGISSRYLRDHFPVAQVTGVDLSPYFLAVAQHIQKQEAAKSSPIKRNIHYVHANGEETGLPSESFDIVSCAFLVHELPKYATSNVLKEARRLLKPGGTIAVIDVSPESKVIQDLAPALFVMMKATEPWLDDYFSLNLKEELERNGFANVTSRLTSPREATVTATAV